MQELHRKYRPAALEDVLGQDGVVKSLKQTLKAGTSRAFIFTGPSGVGKTTLARLVGKLAGCNKANMTEIDAASNTGIDAMRAVTDAAMYAGVGGSPVKLITIDEAHALSKAAWTCMLKAIEEPPPHVYWCLCTTEPVKIPAAIRTRCTCYDLRLVSKDLLYGLLEKVAAAEGLKVPEDVLELLASKAGGSPRQALTTLSQCAGCKDRKEAAGLIRSASEEGGVIDLCRLLIKGAGWPQLVNALKPLREQNGEGIRLTVVGYITSCLMGEQSAERAASLLTILDAFSEPYPSGATVYPVLLSLGRVSFTG